jgi:hypothetical protein
MTEVKYRHPQNPDLVWSGRGRQPKWIEHWLSEGGSLDALAVRAESSGEIDLGIGEPAAPSLGTTLYAQRIVAGHAALPGEVDGELQQAIDIESEKRGATRPDAEVVNMNAQLHGLAEQVNASPVAAQPEASQQQLEVCLQEFGFSAMTAQEFIQSGIDELNQATIRACRAGVAFWAAQEALKNVDYAGRSQVSESTTPERSRTFVEWISDAGLTEQRVYECIRIAKFYSRLPAENRAKALTIGKKHALLLAALPQEVIDQAAESGNDLIQRADMMTVSELKEEIKALQRREKNYEAELERFGNQIKRLSEAKKRTTDFLLRTEDVREECMALQLGAELHLNSLKRIFEETDIQAQEGTLQAEQVWVVANTLAARAADLVEFIRARGPVDLPDRLMSQHVLTQAEAERWILDWPLIENRHNAEAALRKSRREDARPRGPGRPKGSKG